METNRKHLPLSLKKIPSIIIGLFFLLKTCSPLYANQITINQNFATETIGSQFIYHIDKTKKKTLQEIINTPENLFQKNEFNKIIFKRQKANTWLKINISNKTEAAASLILNTTRPHMRHISAYIVQDNKLMNSYNGGMQQSFNDRIIPYHSFAFPINIKKDGYIDIYLKINTNWVPIQFQVHLSSAKTFYSKSNQEYFSTGIFHGLLSVIVLIASLLTITIKSKLYLYYFLHVLFTSVCSFCITGLDYQYIYPNQPVIAHHSKLFFAILLAISLFAFVIEFYKNKKIDIGFSKKLFKIFMPYSLFALLVVVFQNELLLIFPQPLKIFYFIPSAFIGVVFLSIFYALTKATINYPNFNNVTFFIGYFSIALYGILFIFIDNGIIQLTIDTYTPFRLCILIELVCLTILMLQKIFLLQKEKLQLDTEIEFARLEKEKADKIKELDQAKTRLYTNITHEFRTPLTVIKGITEQINGHAKQINIIERNSNILLRLINQMLDLSKAEKGELKLNLIQNDIVEYIRYLSESYSSWAATKNIQLHFSSKVNKCVMDFDSEKTQDILNNLLSNAIKHTRPKGNIYISVKKESGQLIVSVKDEGKGIAPKHLSRIFDRFYQVDQTDTRSDVGSGIGLALCKELVELMNGKIKAQSELNKGSEFLIHLPITNNAIITLPISDSTFSTVSNNTSPKENTDIVHNEDSHSVLVVEDNADVRNYIAYCLKDRYQIIMAENGKEGIEKALEHSPDLIISDLMMPEKNGLEVCETLKTNVITSHIPIILLTAKVGQADKIEGLSLGADAYLAKPFDKEELLVRIDSLIEQRKRIQQHFLQGNKIIKTKKHEIENEFLLKIKNIVIENIAVTDFDVQRLSLSAGMSRSQLYRKIKSLTGRSIAGYVRYIRLLEGKHLLETTDKTISEITYDVGFNDLSYFSKTFSDEFGHPPNEARK